MGILAVACMVAVLAGYSKVLSKTSITPAKQRQMTITATIVVAGWLVIVAALTINGFVNSFSAFPPRPLVLVALPIIAITAWSFTSNAKHILRTIPPHWMVYMQAFRIVVEIILWMAFVELIIPKQMTFEGRNWDVLTGILALPFGYYVQKRKSSTAQLAFNVVGIVLLLNIVIISILSMPTSARVFFNEPANTVVATFPFVYLPTVLVVLAAGLHILSLRQVWLLKKSAVKNTADTPFDGSTIHPA
jgi:uncharacterized membrane protein